MELLIASDGGCKNNGKPDCEAAYGCIDNTGYTSSGVISKLLANASSQRAELTGACVACARALDVVHSNCNCTTVLLILDSAYIADGIKNHWYRAWKANNWITSTGVLAKNIDLWKTLGNLVDKLEDELEEDFMVIQVKSHTNLSPKAPKSLEKAKKSYEKHNGAVPPDDVFFEMIRLNNLADALAGQALSELN